ncbi:hypothetical protein CK203_033520 [Vitis vinifera]|uniref:Uncharacterized protein n=1 Tax=Vitis vinifera TaxID=29760 RepID=A0A438FLB9_VITVI|nr:hypothetical protein CK203_033520 [Vitis vinifera]
MWFEAISGLRANLEKSELIPVGRVENVEELADEFGYKLPRVVRMRLEQIQRDFLWGGRALEQKPHLVRALLGKWVWRFANKRKTLWNQVIRRKYGEERGGWRYYEVREAYGVGLWKAITTFKEAWVNEVWTAKRERRGSWTPRFNKPFNDWEMEEVGRLLRCLDRKKVRVDEEDRVRWMDSKDGVFFAQVKLLCMEGFMGKSSNLGPFAKKGSGFGQ